MEAKEKISKNLKQIVKKLAKKDVEIELSPPERSENGDYYTSIAMRLSSVLKQKPQEIAVRIKDEYEKLQDSTVEKIEVAGPGFLNFFLSKEYLRGEFLSILDQKEKFGSSIANKNQKVMVEFTDPNPFKEFHIGHLYSNIVGESLSRLFESQGAEVRRVCYQGDVGLHVAKAIYGMQKLTKEMPDKNASLAARAKFMGKAYALGATKYEEDKAVKEEIHDLNKKIYQKDALVKKLYDTGRAWSLEYFDTLYARLGTKFERYYFESEVGEAGIELVREFLKKGIFEESDGAVIFPGKKHGLHNRVFINSLGLPTYEAKDLGLAPRKFGEFAYDRSIIITAQEQAEYFKVVLKALELINPDLAARTTHISHGMVRLPTGKMSSRTGDVITGEWLIDEAIARIKKEYPEMDNATAEKVGLAAIKYALLKSTVGRDIEFSFSESISLTGASGPYLQYTYVRTQSILGKADKSLIEGEIKLSENTEKEELEVVRSLNQFPDIVRMAAENLSPNVLTSYLFDLAQKFNLFYQKHQVLNVEDQEVRARRIALTAAVGTVIQNGLKLLGIETVERM